MASGTINEEQKKRSMEALERRFAVTKAEHLHQQHHQIKTQKRVCDADAPLTPYSSATIQEKGNFSFAGYTKSQDTDSNGLIYTKLSHPIDEKLLTNDSEISGKSMVDNVLHKLFQSGDSAQKYIQGSRNTKIDNWILLDNFVQKTGASSRVSVVHEFSTRSKRHMSTRQHKKCGSFELPSEFHKFENFKPMLDIWKGYIRQLLKNVGKNQLAHCLLSADLHGALILVADCKITAFTGVSGIMIRETADTFGIFTEEKKFRVVPKKLSVFILRADCWKITLHGDKLASRSMSQA